MYTFFAEFYIVKHGDGHRFTSNPLVHASLISQYLPEEMPQLPEGDSEGDEAYDDGDVSMCSDTTFDSRGSETWTYPQFRAHILGDPNWRNADVAESHEVVAEKNL